MTQISERHGTAPTPASRDVPEKVRSLLVLLRQFAPARLTASDVETTLNWPRGEVERLCAGGRAGEEMPLERLVQTREARTSSSGERELWLDGRRAAAVDG